MAEVSMKDVKALRERTAAGMMDCKKALEASDGDPEKAIEWLRVKGLADVGKKAGRIASAGAVHSYIHGGGSIGVLVEVNCETDFVANGEAFQGFLKELGMHIAAAAPLYLDESEIPAEAKAHEAEILREAVITSGKPEKIADKIVDGQIAKWMSDVCLMQQAWVKDPKTSIEDLRAELVQKTGENIRVRRFARFVLGEGLQKKSENLAEEVAKMTAAVSKAE